nr:uncharacterized protein LOC128703636 isoform X3 [Cherax quadricarinatus]
MNVTLLVVALAVVGGAGGQGLIPPPPLVTDQPYFDSSMLTNQTAHVGRQAELHCRVHSIGNRTVSWIRGRDLRILTVGRYTYTTDLRYESLHQEGTNQWTLRIKSTQPRDQGTYECQISTKPIKAFTIYLRVLEPRGEILGSPDLYVQKGSMINLTCILYDLPEPPAYVLWYHENKVRSQQPCRRTTHSLTQDTCPHLQAVVIQFLYKPTTTAAPVASPAAATAVAATQAAASEAPAELAECSQD